MGPCSVSQIPAHVLLKTVQSGNCTHTRKGVFRIPVFWSFRMLRCYQYVYFSISTPWSCFLSFFLFNSYIPRHRRSTSSFKHFPTWLPVSGCSKQCLPKDLCVNTIIIQQWMSEKTIVFNEEFGGQMKYLKILETITHLTKDLTFYTPTSALFF